MMTEATATPYLKIHPDDNVLVALQDIAAGTAILLGEDRIILPHYVAAKHKFFLRDMQEGESVIMYGTLVGKVQ